MRTPQTPLARLLGALLLVAAFTVGTTHAQGLGISAGGNFDNLSDIEGDAQASFDNAASYHVGLFYDLTFGAIALRPGVIYVDVGAFDADGDFASEVDKLDIRLIEVPVDARVRLGTAPQFKPYALAGPVLRFNASNDDFTKDNIKDVSVGAGVGVGLELTVPGVGLTLYPEFRYQFGLSDFWDDDIEAANTTFSPSDSQLSTYMLRLGVAL